MVDNTSVITQDLLDGNVPDGTDAILHAFGLEALQKYGYIDYLYGEEPTSPNYADIRPNRDYLRSTASVPLEALDEPLHPIFDRGNFHGFSDPEFESLGPSLRLASAWLNEPALQPFLGGLLDHDSYKRLWHGESPQFEDRPATADAADPTATWKQVATLRDCVSFRAGEHDSLATTNDDVRAPSRPIPAYGMVQITTFPATITLHKEFLNALALKGDILRWHDVQEFGRTEILQRTQLLLAMTITHEIAHALFMVSHEWLPDCKSRWKKGGRSRFLEPFYGDQRIAEVGYALESVLFGGFVQPTGRRHVQSFLHADEDSNPYLCTPAYGLYTQRFPGGRDYGVSDEERRGSARQFGRRFSTFYPLAMDYVHRFFTSEFWDKTVPMYGGAHAHCPQRHHGARRALPPLSPDADIYVEPGDAVQSPPPKAMAMVAPPPRIGTFDPRLG